MDFFGNAQKMKQTAAVSWLWNESESELVGGEKVKVSWLWKESESELVGGEKDQLLEKLHIAVEN